MRNAEWTSRTASGMTPGTGELVPADGHFDFAIGRPTEDVSIRIVNDSPYPSRWQRVKVFYEYADRGARDVNY